MMMIFLMTLSLMMFFFNWFYFMYSMMIFMCLLVFFCPLNLNYFMNNFYLDSLSFSLFFLSFFLFILMLLSSQFIFKGGHFSSFYFFLFFLLLVTLIYSFLINNFLLFYFSFESSLIPTFMLIMGWGLQPERLQASIYFFFYTLLMSIPLLFTIIYLYLLQGGLFFFMPIWFVGVSPTLSFIFMLLIVSAFLVKMPMFFFHLWLPKAHVEAPVSGSMILAGVLLKLGGYGICRSMHYFFNLLVGVSGYLFSLSMMGTIFIGLICCRMGDMKALIAYSSVAHMGLLICSLLGFYSSGFMGSILVMISHGLTSSGLFALINILYERLGSRSIFLSKGMNLTMPIFSLLLFVFCASNFSTPPFISLVSEIYLMFSMMNYSFLMLLIFPVGSFLGTVFSIYLFSYSQHGEKFNLFLVNYPLNLLEIHCMMMHLIPLISLFFSIFYFFNYS